MKTREDRVRDYKITKEFSKTLAVLWLDNKPMIKTRSYSAYPELHWMYKTIKEYRSTLKETQKNNFYDSYKEAAKKTFISQLPGRNWQHTVRFEVGSNLQFQNFNKRLKGQHRKADISICLRPTYVRNVSEILKCLQINYKFILDAKEIKLNNSNIRVFKIAYANIYDDNEISYGYMSMTADGSGKKINNTLKGAIRAGRLAVKNHIRGLITKHKD